MTLVVARIAGSRVAIASDTLITEHGAPLPLRSGVVKSCMLPGDVCVSFSNSPDLAASAIGQFFAQHPEGAGYDKVVSFFEQSSEHTGNDYLLAFARPARLVKIVSGRRIKTLAKTAWIGDQAAFERFKEFESRRHERRKPQHGRAINVALFYDDLEGSPASDLYSVMRNVALDPSIPSVGGFITLISNREEGFRYSAYSDILYDWPGTSEDYKFALTDKVVLASSGENEGFAVSQFTPMYVGLNVTAYYLIKAKRLYLFFGNHLELPTRCEVFRDVEPVAIVETLNTYLGRDLKWLVGVTTASDASASTEHLPQIETHGVRLALRSEANSFAPPGTPPTTERLVLMKDAFSSLRRFD